MSTQALIIHDVGGHSEVRVVLGTKVRTLRLHPNSVRSDGCRVYVQHERGLVEVDPPPATTYRGSVAQDPGATVAASIAEGRLRAMIVDSAGETWMIEPADAALPGVAPAWHVVYRASDVLTTGGQCGSDSLPAPVAAGAPIGVEGGATPLGGPGNGRTQIGFEADFEFFQANGSSTTQVIAYIDAVMNQVASIYQAQFTDPFCYEITGYIVRTTANDPYVSTDAAVMLCEFTDEWNANVPDSPSGIARDVSHMFTGKNMDGTTVGIAWIGTVCDFQFSNCNGGRLHYGISQLYPNGASRVQLTAHELGHNWSACHCNESACTGGPPDPDCGIMNSFLNGSLAFGQRAKAAIDGYRDNMADCLEPCIATLFVDSMQQCLFPSGLFPQCDFPFFIGPLSTVTEGVDAMHWVGGDLSVAGGVYPEALTIGKAMTIKKTPGSPGSVIIGD